MANLREVINDFSNRNILVLGDLILDEYIWGDVDRISPEAPVPVVWAKKHTFVPGGAANVANNIRSFDANVCLVGAIGKDKNTDIFLSELKKRKISVDGVFVEPHRYTTVKTRIIGGHQQIVRLDWEHVEPLPLELNRKIAAFVKRSIKKFDAVIIEDYGKGVINMHLLKEVVTLAHANKKIVIVDPKEDHFQYYRGVTSITPNRKELENAIKNLKIKDTKNRFKFNIPSLSTDADIDRAAVSILKYLNLDSILVTLGESGMRLFEKNGLKAHIPTVAQEVFDVSGAGDTVIGTFTLGLAGNAAQLEAARIANVAAGIVVGKVGTAVTSREELLDRLSDLKEI
ncbi:MAG: D-glycero-beta-D-manno-heptose-7-phosphate kinase [Candidatus Omnitrophota bacterium]|jgi:D-beta-D-heptose 7-phosphate kinase/D-beta-D-heptose 1-phosphate adenosyltransferase